MVTIHNLIKYTVGLPILLIFSSILFVVGCCLAIITVLLEGGKDRNYLICFEVIKELWEPIS